MRKPNRHPHTQSRGPVEQGEQTEPARPDNAGSPSHSTVSRLIRFVIQLHGSPKEIALGTSIGVFVAFTPTVGFQMIIAAFLATLMGANRVAAILPVWITNPITIPAIYGLCYRLGRWFVAGPPVSEVYHRLMNVSKRLITHDIWEIIDQFRELLNLGWEVMVPMSIGGVALGLVCGLMSYPVALFAVRYLRQAYRHLRHFHHPENPS